MPVPKNGRTPSQRGGVAGRGKAPTEPPPQTNPELPEGAVLFDSDTELSEEQLGEFQSKAAIAQKDAQIATLTAQLLTTRNELIRAKKTIEKLVEERDGKNAKGKQSNKVQGRTSAQGGRRGAGKESKPARARAKREGGGKPR
jgi:hypothetical protein